ncbi:MAG: filamentous hemagglutinin N-terminal domain-containing protein [Myxococcales bacterium]|nr:filamentous hemagglutinin N-terminal domain-containing protein [Myxococcales bacterium]
MKRRFADGPSTSTGRTAPAGWRRVLVFTLVVQILSLPLGVPVALANPAGGSIDHGMGSIEGEGTAALTIHQQETTDPGNEMVINWSGGFGIDAGESVHHDQPDADSRILHIDPTGDASLVDGMMTGIGLIYIANPAGVFFGGDAIVDVGGLVAAGGSLSEEDFTPGTDGEIADHFTDLTGAVTVAGGGSGRIQAADLVQFIGRSVVNHGIINAPNGIITLVAGNEVTLTRMGGRVDVVFGAPGGDSESFGVTNGGTLDAGRGEVLLTTGDFYSLAINHTGLGTTTGDHIRLEGGSAGKVEVSGTLDASNTDFSEIGGEIEILGDRIDVSGASVDASGDRRGGTVQVGGERNSGTSAPVASRVDLDDDAEFRADAMADTGDGGAVAILGEIVKVGFATVDVSGGRTGGTILAGAEVGGGGTTPMSRRVYVGETAVLRADSKVFGSAGEIAVRATEAAGFDGTASATGGEQGGRGGRIEVVADAIENRATLDLSAADGEAGVLVRGSRDIRIHGGNAVEVPPDADDGVRILSGDIESLDRVLDISESEIETADVNLEFEAAHGIDTTGEFDHQIDGEGIDVLFVQDVDLTLRTRNADASTSSMITAGIDLTENGARENLVVRSQGSDLNFHTGNGGAVPANEDTGDPGVVPGSGEVANIRLGTLETNGGNLSESTVMGSISHVRIDTSVEAGDAGNVFAEIATGAEPVEGASGDFVVKRDIVVAGGNTTEEGTRGGEAGIVAVSIGVAFSSFEGSEGVTGAISIGAEHDGDLAIDARGGDAMSGAGGSGNRVVLLTADGDIDVLRSLDTSGGSSSDDSAAGGAGGAFDIGAARAASDTDMDESTPPEFLASGDVDIVGFVRSRGGNGSAGGAGERVTIDILGSGQITVSEEIDARGGDGATGPGGDAISVAVATARGAIAVGEIDTSGGVALATGARARAGNIVVDSDSNADSAGSESNAVTLNGQLVALGTGEQDVGSVSINASSDLINNAAAGADIVTDLDVTLQGETIGRSSAFQIDADGEADGDGNIDSTLAVRAADLIDVEVIQAGFDAFEVSVDRDTFDVQVLQHHDATDDSIRATGVATSVNVDGVDVAASTALFDSDTTESGATYAFVMAKTEATLVVETGSEARGGTTRIRSRGDLLLGNAAGAAITAHDGITLALSAGYGPETATGDVRVNPEALASGVKVLASGNLVLRGDRIGGPGEEIVVDRAGATTGRLTVDAAGGVAVDVTGTAYETLSVIQQSAGDDVDIDNASLDRIRATGDGDVHTLSEIDTTGSGAALSYALEAGETGDLAVAEGARIAGDTLLQSQGAMVLGAAAGSAGPVLTATEAANLTLQARNDGGTGKIRDSIAGADAASLDMSAGGHLLLLADIGVGENGNAITTSGGASVGAATTDGGIFLANETSGDLRIAAVVNPHPNSPDDTESAFRVSDVPGVGLSVENGLIQIRNSSGDLRLESGVASAAAEGAVFVAAGGEIVLALGEGQEIDSAGDQVFASAVALESDASLRSAGDVEFQAEIDSAAGGPARALSVVAGGTTRFGDGAGSDRVGGSNALASLTTEGSALVNSTRFVTTGEQLFGGAVGVASGRSTRFESTQGAVTFASTLDGPGHATVAAATRATFRADVGADASLGTFEVVAPEIAFDTERVVAGDGGITLNPDGRPDVPDRASIFGTRERLSLETSGRLFAGRREKISVPGSLEIHAANLVAGDLAAVEISIDAERYTVLGREAGSVLLPNGRTTIGDLGVDISANRVRMNVVPEWDGFGDVARVLTPRGDYVGPGPGNLVKGLLNGDGSGVGPENLRAGDLALDLGAVSGGPNPAPEIPREQASIIDLIAPRFSDELPAPLSPVGAAEMLAFLRCDTGAAVCADPSEFGGPLGIEAARAHQVFFGTASEPQREAMRTAAHDFAANKRGRLDARALSAEIERTPGTTAAAYLDHLRELLARVRMLPVDDDARAALERRILEDAAVQLGVRQLDASQLEAATASRGLQL